jgi:argininosuccinate lyase
MTTEEFGFLRVADALTTGSSVMPQKHNLDFAEVTKAKASVVAGHLQAMLGITRGNLSGYNRDAQWTKTSLLDAIRECMLAPRIFARAIATLTVDDEHERTMLEQCRRGYLNAVDVADYLAASKNVPFRTAHGVVKNAVDACRPNVPALTTERLNDALARAGLDARMTDAEVASLSDPLENLKRRTSAGSPNPDETQRCVDRLESEIKAQTVTWNETATRLRAARDALR